MAAVSQKAASGDLRATLTALRDRLAADLDQADTARDVATLSKELREVLAALDTLPVGGGVSKVDELTRKRQERQAG